MSVLDRVLRRAQDEPNIAFTPEETQELESETIKRWETFNDEYLRVVRGKRALERYEHVKRYLEYKHPSGRPLSRQEIATEVGIGVGSLDPYIRLHDFEQAYNASTTLYSFIVVLPDGSGNLVLSPEHKDVLAHHATLTKRIESMEKRIDAREYASLVRREG